MRKELDELLCQKYPKIFRGRRGDIRMTAMAWGFEIGDGWFNIVDQMCSNIQNHIHQTRKQRATALVYNRALTRAAKGDYSTYNLLSKWHQKEIDNDLKDYELYQKMAIVNYGLVNPKPQMKPVPEACPQVVATQVKEKFGTLRFYYHGGDDIVSGIERMAEAMSSVMCEECGAPGHKRGGGWIKTLCDEHHRQREERNVLRRI